MSSPPHAAVREGLVVFAISAALTALVVHLGGLVPLLANNAAVVVAIVFLYLPLLALKRRGQDPTQLGLDAQSITRGIPTGVVVTLLTLPFFLIGYHLWAVLFFDKNLDVDPANYAAWPEELRVQSPEINDGLTLWRNQRTLVLEWDGPGDWQITLTADGVLHHLGGPEPLEGRDPPVAAWHVHAVSGHHQLVFWVEGGDDLTITPTHDGRPLDGSQVWLGANRQAEGALPALVLERSVLWIPLALLIQLLIVALPEEFFYRGYLQSRLASAPHRVWRLGPLHTTVPIIATSALFAFGHVVTELDPQRLAVFFPSLVFGWLRDRTGGLGGGIVYHAACNLMVSLWAVHYI